jgi:CBS domain-containing protein
MNDPTRLQMLELIGAADSSEALRSLRDQVHEQMEALLPASPVEQLVKHLNDAHDAVIQRSIALAEAQMARLGKGSPPVPYAYMLFGSGGRSEQTLSSDQDSGIVYEDPVSDSAEISDYFKLLSDLVVENLQQAGYPPCEGEVISNNSEWCMSISEWGVKLDRWFKEPSWEAVRYLLIVADGRCVYGDHGLGATFKDGFFTDMLGHPIILKRMLDNTLRHKMLVGIFGQLLKERYGEDAGSLDIKYGAYIPMVNSIRLLSVMVGIRETSTLERIAMLEREGQLTQADARVYKEAFLFFLRLRLLTTVQTDDGFYANNGKMSSRKLTKEMIDELKRNLRLGKKLQKTVYKQTMGKLT